ncbi:hypothetical protein, partial [Holdemanella biformis]|uniref:hypothetical protein n=1 Tax=Holdemanella biformis TaxID=1735 RepID=UPI0024934F94
MKIDEINKLTDAQLEEQKLYYENRKAGFKEYHNEFMIADRVLYDINKEVQKREKCKKCYKHNKEDKYICATNFSPVCLYENACIVLEDSNFLRVDDFDYVYAEHEENYVEIPKEEFLNKYLL